MIGCVFGPIRAGKTYHTVATFVIPMLQSGHTVVTNISGIDKMALSALWKIDVTNLIHIDDEDVFGFWRIAETRKRVVFIIDEIQNFYGSSNYRQNKDSREELKVFLTKCGHDGHSVVYICQVPEMVHTDILRLTETFIQCAKINFIKFLPSNRYTWIARKSYKTKGSTVLEQGIVTYNPKVYVCYQSTTPGVTETKTKFDQMGYIPWRVIIPILILIIGLIFYKTFFAPKPPVSMERPGNNGSNNVLQNLKGGSNEQRITLDTVDGWMADGKDVAWLRGVAIVSYSPDTMRYRTGLHATYGGGFIFCRPHQVAPGIQTGPNPSVEPAGNGSSVGSNTTGGSSVSSGGGL